MSEKNSCPGLPTGTTTIPTASVADESPRRRCMCCHRPLSDPVSVSRGFGRVCFGRVRLDQHAAMVAVVRQRIDQLSMTVPVLDGDQLESVDAALADLLDALGIGSVIA